MTYERMRFSGIKPIWMQALTKWRMMGASAFAAALMASPRMLEGSGVLMDADKREAFTTESLMWGVSEIPACRISDKD